MERAFPPWHTNIMENVKFSVEKALGVPVAQVNVHVQGLRVSNPG